MGERRDRSNGVDRHNPPQVVWIPLMNLTTVKAVWDALVAEYENRSQTSIIDLYHQMTSLRCRKTQHPQSH